MKNYLVCTLVISVMLSGCSEDQQANAPADQAVTSANCANAEYGSAAAAQCMKQSDAEFKRGAQSDKMGTF